MFNLNESNRIVMAQHPTDMRKCARGLAVLRNLPPLITVLIIPNSRVTEPNASSRVSSKRLVG